MDAGDKRKGAASWARPSQAAPVRPSATRALRDRLRDVSWFDVAAAVVATAIFDFVAGLIISGYFAAKCHDVCTLHQQAHEDRMLLILVPTLVCAPPVLVALLLKRMRIVIATVQLIICVALTTHAVLDLRTVESHINGTAPCWNKLFPPKDCPWGPV